MTCHEPPHCISVHLVQQNTSATPQPCCVHTRALSTAFPNRGTPQSLGSRLLHTTMYLGISSRCPKARKAASNMQSAHSPSRVHSLRRARPAAYPNGTNKRPGPKRAIGLRQRSLAYAFRGKQACATYYVVLSIFPVPAMAYSTVDSVCLAIYK